MKNPIVPILGLFALGHSADAAPVTWTTGPTSTINESSISLNGTLVTAGTWGDSAGTGPLTVPVGSENIVFNQMPTGTDVGTGNAIATASGTYYDPNSFIPPGASNENFQKVMDGFAWDGPNPKVIVLGNLIPNATYQVQLFTSDDRGCCGSRTQKWSDNATNGAGNETGVFTMSSSSYVIGSFVADSATQNLYTFGVAQSSNAISAYVLRLLAAPDADHDGIPDAYEDAHSSFLNKNNAADAALDHDGDGLSNLKEYQAGSDPSDPDTDDDGLLDGPEVNTHHSSPLQADSDGDTLSDFTEVNAGTNPNDPDTDHDNFIDPWELAAGSNPSLAASTPNGTTVIILGTGTGALLQSDLTDPENNGNDSTPNGSNFNWVSINSSSKSFFHTADGGQAGAFDIFDNKVGNGEEKWCCDGAPQDVTVEFDAVVSLTHFTITSTGDSPQRDPRVWEIQGSNDGANFTPITRFDFSGKQLWTERNQVIRVNLPAPASPYKFIRYQVYATGSGEHSINELELFGTKDGTDADNDGLPAIYESRYSTFLHDNNAADANADQDSDGLSNLQEFQLGTRPDLADTDGDGLPDAEEVNIRGTNPVVADSDGDGLSDGLEVNTYHSDPLVADTDGDRFTDGYEVAHGGNPTDPNVGPGAKLTVLGTGTNSLIGHDVTDHDNDGVEGANPNTSGFDWVTISSTVKPYFSGFGDQTEGAFDLFDNKVGGGEAKLYSPTSNVKITMELPHTLALKYFTLSSADDSPLRDPRVWSIEGSTNGTTFTPIFAMTDDKVDLWDQRNQVLRFDLAATAPAYKYFRFSVTKSGGTDMQLSEIELFGTEQDSDGDGMPDYFEERYGLNPNSNTDANGDIDNDGLTNLQEFQHGGNPEEADTDHDGLSDSAEVAAGTLLNEKDSDHDGFSDSVEVSYGSNPLSNSEIPNFVPINWGAPTNITGKLTDFSTAGTLVQAWTGGGGPITINGLGITFQPGIFLGDRYGGYDPYNRNQDQDYENLLTNGTYGGSNAGFIEIPGLTPGQQYQVQIWVADTRDCCAGRTWSFGTYDGDDPSVNLNSGVFGNEGSFPGQYVIGTFTAQHPSHFVYASGASGSQLNAMMVRQVSTPSQPVVTHTGFSGGVFQITVNNLDTTKTYQLKRSTNLASFANLGTTFTPAAAQQIVTDPAPPAGKAFYRIVEVTP